MSWHTLIDPTLSSRLCLTLLHSLWQITLVALLVWCIDRLWKSLAVEQRYTLYVSALVLACLSLPINIQWLRVTDANQAELSQSGMPAVSVSVPPGLPAGSPELELPAEPLPVPPQASFTETADSPNQSTTSSQATDRHSHTPIPFDWSVLPPWIAAFYLAGVVLMLMRLLAGHLRIARVRAAATPVSTGPCVEYLARLTEQWNLKVRPVLTCAEQIVVPQVTGLLRPTILLPASVISSLSIGELELILAHELAHIRRYDLWINLLQRMAEVILFFNPALWYLSQRISLLREYCCDEMTCRTEAEDHRSLETARVVYSTALLRVAELAHRSRLSEQQLTSLSAAGKSPSEIRRRVARLFGEPLHEPLPVSRGGFCTLLVLMLALPFFLFLTSTTAQTAEQEQPAEKSVAESQDTKPETDVSAAKDTERLFQLTVVDPAGKRVPHATVEIRSDPSPTAEQIVRGKFLREATYGPFAQTNEQGELFFKIPQKMKRFNLSIKKSDFGPYWAGWSVSERTESVPEKFTAILETGWSVGGIVVDEAGKPIAGAQVSPSVKYKKRPGDKSELYVGTRISTDAKGRWQFHYVPESESEVFLSVNHPEFSPWRERISRDQFEVRKNRGPSAKVELQRGLDITGSVTDEKGKPISGALVRTKFMNDIRKATTDEHGIYVLSGCEPRLTRVVVSAKGRAPEVQEVRVKPEMDPVDFKLVPGRKIRVRVVDEQGKGIPRARIFFQQWRGSWIGTFFEFRYVHQYTDKNGVWEWDEAPVDEFQADIYRPDGMSLSRQTLIAREQEYVFTPPQALVASGRVIDAKTKEPIKKFQVTTGFRDSHPQSRVIWNTTDAFEAQGGSYQVRITRDEPAHFIKLAALGYRVAVSRQLKNDEGTVKVDFELEPAQDIAATVLTPDHQPAKESKVAVGVKDSFIRIQNGDIRENSTYATFVRTDAQGRFHTPAPNGPFQLIITHPTGFAHYKSDSGPLPDPLKLTPWARVEGQFQIGKTPVPKVPLEIQSYNYFPYGDDGPSITNQHRTSTGSDGKFVFERVWPGKGYLGREISFMVNDGVSDPISSILLPLDFKAGITVAQNLGGKGRPVIGKLAPPANHKGKVLWQFTLINGHRFLDPPPGMLAVEEMQKHPQKYQNWYKNWKASNRYADEKVIYEKYTADQEKLLSETPHFKASIATDGSFRIDDVPPGNYALSAHCYEQKKAGFPGHLINHIFTVPPVDQSGNNEPVDLGTLTLE